MTQWYATSTGHSEQSHMMTHITPPYRYGWRSLMQYSMWIAAGFPYTVTQANRDASCQPASTALRGVRQWNCDSWLLGLSCNLVPSTTAVLLWYVVVIAVLTSMSRFTASTAVTRSHGQACQSLNDILRIPFSWFARERVSSLLTFLQLLLQWYQSEEGKQ